MRSATIAPDRRPLIVVSILVMVITIGLLPFAGHEYGPSISFVPAMLSVVACFDILSAFLLVADYLDRGDMRLLVMAGAYVWSLTLMVAYAMSFPGVLASAPFATTTSVAPYCYLGWHAGYPTLLGLAWAPWPSKIAPWTPAKHRRAIAVASLAIVFVVAAGIVAFITLDATHLPTLIVGLSTARMAKLTAPITLPIVALSLAVSIRGLRARKGPERWTSVAILVCFCDLVLTYGSHYRFSLGWYVGRALTLTAAGVIFMSMLAQFRRLKSTAELHATTDPLTGAANRRALEQSLADELERADRIEQPTSILALDLDGFKAINDRQGHAAGDAILQSAVLRWSGALRSTDTLARIGGDEFIIILPGTPANLAQIAAQRIADATPNEVGVSIGIATVAGGTEVSQLLSTADRELYSAKANRHPQRVVPTPRSGSETFV